MNFPEIADTLLGRAGVEWSERAPEIAEFSLKEVALRPGHEARQAKKGLSF